MLASFDYIDLGGGVNRGVSPDRIPSRQAAQLINFYPYGTHLKRRGGHHLVADTGVLIAPGTYGPNPIDGMIAYSPEIGSWKLLVGGDTQFYRVDGDVLNVLPITGEASVPSAGVEPFLWSTVQYKKYTYWLRKFINGRFYRVNANVAARAGIAAPTGAPTIADGAAGVLTAGDYRAVYTYYNSLTAMESNPSPISNTLALAASNQIDYTGITVSTDPFVTARRIYRTIPDQVGVYFFVAQIDDNSTTTYTGDNVAVADLGRPVSFDNGVPPDDLYIGEIWNERLFASDGVDVFFSEFLLPECFGEESSISVYPDDGHQVTALRAFGDRLIIGKSNAIHYLTGTDARNFALATLTDRHGCASQASMKVAEGNLFWLGMDRHIYRSDGTSVKKISDPQVASYLALIDDDQMERVCAGVLPEKGWYVINFGDTGSYTRGELLVYNYREDTWTLFDIEASEAFPLRIRFMTDFFDVNGTHRLYGTDSGRIIYNLAEDGYPYDDLREEVV